MDEGNEPLETSAGPPRSLAWVALVVLILALSFWPRRAPTPAVVASEPTAPVLPQVPPPERPRARLDGDVVVRVVDPGGAPLAGVGVAAKIRGPRGAALFEALEDTDPRGRATFRGLAGFARSFEAGSALELTFAEDLPGSLGFGTRSLPDRELVLVRDAPVPLAPAAPVIAVEALGPPVETALPPVPEPDAAPPVGLVAARSELEPEPEPAVVTPAPKTLLAGSLVGQLRWDPGIPARELQLELEEVLPGEAGRVGRRLGPLAPDTSGAFRFDGVAPGLCALRVSLFGSESALAWVDELELAPGDVHRDARLEPFDLSGRIGSIEVELFDAAGRRLEPAVVAPVDKRNGTRGGLRQQGIGSTPRLFFDRRALLGQGGLDLVLEAPGFAPRAVHATSEELSSGGRLSFRMQQRRAATLELRLMDPPREGVVLEARLERPDGQRRPWDFDLHRGLLDERGRLRLEPAETGAFVVRLARIEGGARHDLNLAVPIDVRAYEGSPTARDDSEEDVRVLFLPLDPGQL